MKSKGEKSGAKNLAPFELAKHLRELATMVPPDWPEVCEQAARKIERSIDMICDLEKAMLTREDRIIEAYLRQALREIKKAPTLR